ncbi:SusD family protein [uncultured Paludibacter sp.]|nr:SusD family protein [uncultured Paludibacter sp.]
MKKSIKIFIVSVVAIFSSCTDYLNVEPLFQDRRDLEDVFQSVDYSRQWLAGVYSHLRNDNFDVTIKEQNANQFNFISDDMFYTDRGKVEDMVFGLPANYPVYRGGKYDERFLQTSWRECYIGIRDASIYIHNIEKNKEMSEEEVITSRAEARFLRAYYYWQLLRKYGPIPILPDEGVDFTKDYEELAIPRSTYEECVDYITAELALAARDLPGKEGRSNREIAKPTKGAALAARAKVYLYGASPQYNGNTSAFAKKLVNNEGKSLLADKDGNVVYKPERWAKAAAAAKEVMDLGEYQLYTVPKRTVSTGNMKGAPGASASMTFDYYRYPKTIEPPVKAGYSDTNFPEGWADIDPCESYRQLFDGSLTAFSNPELIFTRGYGDFMNNLSIHQMPRSLGGWNCHGITLKTYDAYYMNDGSDFDRNSSKSQGYTDASTRSAKYYLNYPPLPPGVSLQNANREPRFYASVAYNGSIWENEGSNVSNNLRYNQIFYFRDSPDGKEATGFYIWTGIGIRKYYNPEDWSGYRVPKAEPAIRYAEVLLTYAEALNELPEGANYSIPTYDGEGTINVSRNQSEISKGLRPVRVRAGLSDFTDTYFGDQVKMRELIKREWQIEFMGESHRYYDLRRWKDAEKEEAMPVWGFNMNMTKAQIDFWHTPVEISQVPAIFADKMYLWPISHDELRKNRKLTQNPGWTTFDE